MSRNAKEDRYQRVTEMPGRAGQEHMPKILWFWTLTLRGYRPMFKKYFGSVTSTAVSPRAIWQASQPVFPLQERFPS